MAAPSYPVDINAALFQLANLACHDLTDHGTLSSILSAYSALAPITTLPMHVYASRQPDCPHATIENSLLGDDYHGNCNECMRSLFKYGCNDWLDDMYKSAVESEKIAKTQKRLDSFKFLVKDTKSRSCGTQGQIMKQTEPSTKFP